MAAAVIGERSIYHVNGMGMVLSVVSFLLFARILLRLERPGGVQ
jgi:Na+-transporting methylmalonyl-CoA/oxaloacetate decarboxylase gamma subunit